MPLALSRHFCRNIPTNFLGPYSLLDWDNQDPARGAAADLEYYPRRQILHYAVEHKQSFNMSIWSLLSTSVLNIFER